MTCTKTNSKHGNYYQVVGDNILDVWLWEVGNEKKEKVMSIFKCDVSKFGQQGSDIQCVGESSTLGGYSVIDLRPEEGMALLSWGNHEFDNHVVTYEPVECTDD